MITLDICNLKYFTTLHTKTTVVGGIIYWILDMYSFFVYI